MTCKCKRCVARLRLELADTPIARRLALQEIAQETVA